MIYESSRMNKKLVCISGENWLEKHATKEFMRYMRNMLDVKPKIAVSNKMEEIIVSIGRNRVTESLIKKEFVALPNDLGEEGFIVKAIKANGIEYLILCGGSPKGTLYAVYHYLEKFCRVGFFGDEEYIPKLDEIPTKNVDVLEKPRWPERQYLLSVVYSYSTYWWSWKEWKQEIDWAAKHRFNIMSCPPGATIVWRKVWKHFGVDVPPTSLSGPPFLMFASAHKWDLRPPFDEGFQEFIDNLSRKIINYGRKLGIKWVSPAIPGLQVPKEFYDTYRDCACFMDVKWCNFSSKYIHPNDPLYTSMWKIFLKEYSKHYGSDHLWWLPNFFEMDPGEELSDHEKINLKKDIAKKTYEATKEVDPTAILICFGWTFAIKKFWPRKHVEAFLAVLPKKDVRVWELWEDYLFPSKRVSQPLYKDLNYYFGKPWLLGFLHSFAGETSLHGNLAGTIDRVKEASLDPKAAECLGIAVQMEVIHHNHIFYDLLARLGWNPDSIDLKYFLKDYAERRYGKVPAPIMIQCLEELVASVYSTSDTTSPLYQLRIEPDMLRPDFKYMREPSLLTLAERNKFIPHLQKALAIALQLVNELSSSPLYQHDIIDICRQFLGDLFNLHIVWLYDAFKKGDDTTFEKEARKIEEILESQEMILSSNKYFCLKPILEKAKALPNAPKDFDKRIKDILTIWIDEIPDYARRDYYELLRFCYHKRVSTFIKHLREKLDKGTCEIDRETLLKCYHEIEYEFIDNPFPSDGTEKYASMFKEAVTKAFEKHQLSEEELKMCLCKEI